MLATSFLIADGLLSWTDKASTAMVAIAASVLVGGGALYMVKTFFKSGMLAAIVTGAVVCVMSLVAFSLPSGPKYANQTIKQVDKVQPRVDHNQFDSIGG